MTTSIISPSGTVSIDYSDATRLPQALKKQAVVLFTSFAAIGILGGTSSAPQRVLVERESAISSPQTVVGELAEDLLQTSWLANAEAGVRSDRDELLWLKSESDLTWDQIGKVLGVSRRAVHFWATGGRMNEANASLLREFSAIVRALPASGPAQRRSALLSVGPDGRNVLDRLRSRDGKLAGRSWGAPLTVEEMIGTIPTEEP